MAAYYQTSAWLLASYNMGEADRRLTFFTKELGRVDAIAKGARLQKSKLRGHLTLFSYARILLTPGRELWRLLDAECTQSKEDAPSNIFVQEFADFINTLASHGMPDEELWNVVRSSKILRTQGELVQLKCATLVILGMLDAGALRGKSLEMCKKMIAETLRANHMVQYRQTIYGSR